MRWIAYAVTALTIAGTVANAARRRWGFLVWAITNTFWCVYNLINDEKAQAALYAFNMIMALYGLWRWKKDEEAERRWQKDFDAMPEEGEKPLALIDAKGGTIRFFYAREVAAFDEKEGWTDGREFPEEQVQACEWTVREE